MSNRWNRFSSEKILVYSDKLQQIAQGELPNPVAWHIYPSNICNHKCVWCMYRQNGEQFVNAVKLDRETLLKGVTDAARTGAVMVRFTGGGEPLLNRHTKEAMELANELGLEVALDTNGTRLSPEIAQLAHNIRISLNAGTKETHWRVNHGSDERDPGDFDKIIQNVKKARSHCKRDIGFGFVVDHNNTEDILPFVELAIECGVDWVHIRPAFWYDEAEDKATRDVMQKALEYSQEAKRRYDTQIQIFAITDKFDGYWTPRSYSRCQAVKFETVLTATGDFAVCLDRMDLRFGRGYRCGESFEEVWNSKEHKDLIETIIEGQELDKCPRCVWNNRNVIIDEVFTKDSARLKMI